ncbi:hypothetical protein V6Z11_A09G104500 [Gossypium hirsutum]
MGSGVGYTQGRNIYSFHYYITKISTTNTAIIHTLPFSCGVELIELYKYLLLTGDKILATLFQCPPYFQSNNKNNSTLIFRSGETTKENFTYHSMFDQRKIPPWLLANPQ